VLNGRGAIAPERSRLSRSVLPGRRACGCSAAGRASLPLAVTVDLLAGSGPLMPVRTAALGTSCGREQPDE